MDARFNPPPMTLEAGQAAAGDHHFTPQALVGDHPHPARSASPVRRKKTWSTRRRGRASGCAQLHGPESETGGVGEIIRQLEKVPGFGLLGDSGRRAEGRQPSDFLEPETWKGRFTLSTTLAKMQMDEMKKRILGEEDKMTR